MSRKVLDKDVGEGEVLPSQEIVNGKIFRQRGKLNTSEGTFEYFLERTPDTEQKMEVFDATFDLVEIDAAIFELSIKDPVSGEWLSDGPGLGPINIDVDTASDRYMF